MLQQYKRKGDDKLGLLEQSEWMKLKDGTVYESRLLKLEKQLTDLLAKSSQSKVSITPLQLCVLQSTFLFLKIFPKCISDHPLPYFLTFRCSHVRAHTTEAHTVSRNHIFRGVPNQRPLLQLCLSRDRRQ